MNCIVGDFGRAKSVPQRQMKLFQLNGKLGKHMAPFAILQKKNYIKRVAQVWHEPCCIRAVKVVIHFSFTVAPLICVNSSLFLCPLASQPLPAHSFQRKSCGEEPFLVQRRVRERRSRAERDGFQKNDSEGGPGAKG